MFRIPNFYEMPNMTFEEAKGVLAIDGDLLKGMERVDGMWERHCADQKAFYTGKKDELMYADDDEFYEHWVYEVNAYNVVAGQFQPLLEVV